MANDTLQKLAAIIEERKSADPASSYVAQLHHKGLEKILSKVEEEAAETIEAAREAGHDGDTDHLVYETADLWFHSLVMRVLTPSWMSLTGASESAAWMKKRHGPSDGNCRSFWDIFTKVQATRTFQSCCLQGNEH